VELHRSDEEDAVDVGVYYGGAVDGGVQQQRVTLGPDEVAELHNE
jgi:hypothetical protein